MRISASCLAAGFAAGQVLLLGGYLRLLPTEGGGLTDFEPSREVDPN